ncbi:MAG: ABC transporter permease [Eubacterium sp.]|nr:ABC transporter permease [Eubacterium sp.]
MKLLLRTKAFWFFLILMPMLSTLILKVKFDSSAAYLDNMEEKITELESDDSKVAYYGGKGEYVVKVYDASHSEISEYVLNKLAKSGLILVCRADISDIELTDDYVDKRIKKDGYEDKMGVALFLQPDFEEKASAGKAEEAVNIYVLSDDERTEALENELKFQLARVNSACGKMGTLEMGDDLLPEKELVSVAGGNGRNLTIKQTNQKTQMGYAFAFMTLGYVFCGIFVAHSAIKEQKNGVYTRISLTKASTLKYFASKFVTTFIISLMIAIVVSLCSIVLDTNDLGMSKLTYILIIFMQGLIFSSVSMLIGILLGDVMSANVAAFCTWCFSALLSGLYFPLNYTSTALKVMSFMMPQKWFLEGTEMIFVGDNKALPMLICITVAYIAVSVSLGSLGLKMRRTDSWGNS